MNKTDNMAQLLVNDMANNIQPKELFDKFSRILDKDLDHNHKRRVFLNDFLSLYRNSVDDKMAFNESRLKYYKTIEYADAELKALREEHGSYDEPKQLDKKDRPELTNETAQRMKKAGKRNEPVRDEILNTAFEIIKDTGEPLSFFQTPSGDANTKLYNHPKIRSFDDGNSRRWIREAMKDGTFKKMMATDGHGLATK